MLQSVKTFVRDRQWGITKAAGIVGGLYLARQYIKERLEEVKERLEQERIARDNLERRFHQTQEDVSYTVLALIQTLSDQILQQMDVEGLTQELQSRSRARQSSKKQTPRPPSSLASSIDLVHQDGTSSETGSAALSISSSYHVAETSGEHAALPSGSSTSGLQNWVESSSIVHIKNAEVSAADTGPISSTYETQSVTDSIPSDSAMSSSFVSDSSTSRTTAELWNEVELLTFTRTLTTLYSTTLLSLLTVIQLTLLARSKYVQSIVTKEREERMRERLEAEFLLTNILLGHGGDLEKLMSGDMDALLEEGEEFMEGISETVESKFLTMSWWILHVGWKDLGERVRRGVEEAFDGVSLKSKLGAIDLHRLIGDVRRRVEHEITFEGHERRINFLSSLLPPTLETVHHVLAQGGFASESPYKHLDILELDESSATSSQLSQSHRITSSPSLGFSSFGLPPPRDPPMQDAPFSELLAETHSIICSSDFARVLEVCLDQATEVLFSGLEKSVFVSTEPQLPPGETVRIRLVGLLPGLARWSQLALNGIPNDLVNSLLNLREVECLSAIIFSRFEDRFR